MAVNVVFPFLIPLEENILNVTRLMSGQPPEKLKFGSKRYCSLVFEDSPVSTTITKVKANHSEGEPFVYSITRGNEDGLFTVNATNGEITVAAPLDNELKTKHSLVVSAETSSGEYSETRVEVQVADVNDNSPEFILDHLKVEVIEEDHLALPQVIGTVGANDPDWVDEKSLLYTLEGDGVDGFSTEDAYFSVDPKTGQVTQLRPLDRDPPNGKSIWKLRVKVHDGQNDWVSARINAFRNQKISKPFLDPPLTNIFERNQIFDRPKRFSNARRKRPFLKATKKSQCCRDKENQKLSKLETKRLTKKNKDPQNKFEKRLKKLKKSFEGNISYRSKSQPNRQTGSKPNRKIATKNNRISKKKISYVNFDSNHLKHKINEKLANDRHNSSFRKNEQMPIKHININKNITHFIDDIMNLYKLENDFTAFSPNLYEYPQENMNKNVSLNQKSSSRSSRFSRLSKYVIPETLSEDQMFSLEPLKFDNVEIKNSRHATNRYSKRGKPNMTMPIKSDYPNMSSQTLRRTYRHLSSSSDDIQKTCDLIQSLTTQLSLREQATLKYMVSKIKTLQGYSGQQRVHVVEAEVTVSVKDINDNPPTFPNTTIYAEVQENGPVDLHVTTVTAWDADDPESSTNAVLRYYLEKNAVDETNGSPIFRIVPLTGEIRTALCCLDRESTFEYHLQVVAMDGGGLKGTGTVAVVLSDVNDNSPRFARGEWRVVIDETEGTAIPPDNSTLFEITVNDLDTSNYFLYRVVKSSGWGCEFFDIRTSGSVGEVFALKPLDFEDERQRRGFRFLVEVTDRGSWEDPRSIQSAWVVVELRDVNDNAPVFQNRLIHVTVKENIPRFSVIARIIAEDPDQNGTGSVDFTLLDDWCDLRIEPTGDLLTTTLLDREGQMGSRGLVRVLARDQGTPSRSSTATVVIYISDVNDTPPRLIGSRVLHVAENVEPTRVGVLLATDDDNWGLGHGPPFSFDLDGSNPSYVFENFHLRYIKELDSGRGGAELWTTVPLDREKRRQIVVMVTLRDATNLAASNDVVVVVDDVNDNDMSPAHKTIYLWKTRNGRGVDYPIGRVFVEDPDDCDFGDKVFLWATEASPLFSLDEATGEILASPSIPQHRYDLRFKVSDYFRGQRNVEANVTVNVRILDDDLISHAVPITLHSITASSLTRNWTPKSHDGGLGNLTSILEKVTGSQVEVVSVSSGQLQRSPSRLFSLSRASNLVSYPDSLGTRLQLTTEVESFHTEDEENILHPMTTVWIAAKSPQAGRIKAPKLRALLEMAKTEIETSMDITVEFSELRLFDTQPFSTSSNTFSAPVTLFSSSSSSVAPPIFYPHPEATPSSGILQIQTEIPHPQTSSAKLKDSDKFPLQVVDANATSLVSPLIPRYFTCLRATLGTEREINPPLTPSYHSCNPFTCLNGGRCIPTRWGDECVCPGKTKGRACKLLSRSFHKHDFLWLDPLPPCYPLKISLRFLTLAPDGVLLYSGPLADRQTALRVPSGYGNLSPTPLLIVQIVEGRPSLVIVGPAGTFHLVLNRNHSLADGDWHDVTVTMDTEGASLMDDTCDYVFKDGAVPSECYAKVLWRKKFEVKKFPWKVPWQISVPLQVGGIAHNPLTPSGHGWHFSIVSKSLEGCIENLRINEKLIDLGEPLLERGKGRECIAFQSSCSSKCSPRGRCVKEGDEYICSCPAGYEGNNCERTTTPVTINVNEEQKLDVDFKLESSKATVVQLRFKTYNTNVSILRLNSVNSTSLQLRLVDGHLCLDYKPKKIEHISQPEVQPKNSSSPPLYEKEIPREKIQLKIKELNTQIQESIKPQLPKNKNQLQDIEEEEVTVCLPYVYCSDGLWHVVRGKKKGHRLSIEVDDGDQAERNETIPTALKNEKSLGNVQSWPFVVNPTNSIVIGDKSIEKSDRFFHFGQPSIPTMCIDDLRLNEQSVPVKKKSHSMSKKKSTTMTTSAEEKEEEEIHCLIDVSCGRNIPCEASKHCQNVAFPDMCKWCPQGYTPTMSGCQRYDMCQHNPCLHGGSCSTVKETVTCSCPPPFTGTHCQWKSRRGSQNDLTIPLLTISFALCFLLLVLLGVMMCWYVRRRSCRRENDPNASQGSSPTSSTSARGARAQREKRGGSMVKCDTTELQIEVIDLRRKEKLLHFQQPNSRTLSSQIEDSVNKTNAQISPHHDDLRAYAYEGEGSSSCSLGSDTAAVLKEEHKDSLEILPIHSTLKDVVDLLKDLPDGYTCSSLRRKKSTPAKSILEELNPRQPKIISSSPLKHRSSFQMPTSNSQKVSDSSFAIRPFETFKMDISL